MNELSTRNDAPLELSAEQLELVSGGTPRGTWSEQQSTPRGTWSEEQSSTPRGTW